MKSLSPRTRFVINRVLIIISIAAILGGLLFNEWVIVLRNAILL